MLGALFGYLYFFSGKLSLAMLGHFFNNAFTLVVIYLDNLGWIQFDLEDSSQYSIPEVAAFFVAFAALLSYFIYYQRKQSGAYG
ncbi:MAG: hypothetical protein HC842_02185 [Cytophagales bacterium]|nr:hypothetical protein [Cytophagales bacterium]